MNVSGAGSKTPVIIALFVGLILGFVINGAMPKSLNNQTGRAIDVESPDPECNCMATPEWGGMLDDAGGCNAWANCHSAQSVNWGNCTLSPDSLPTRSTPDDTTKAR